MRPRQPHAYLALLAAGFLLLVSRGSSAQWQRIVADPALVSALFDGVGESAPAPSCADGSMFSFFVYPGPDLGGRSQLLLGFDGGGACWDAATCIGSRQPGARSIYRASVGETVEDLDALTQDTDGSGAGGILAERGDNPFAGFAKVFIPYCTGDVHIGSADRVYTDPDYCPEGCTVRHRGYDNLRVVLRWLQRAGAGAGAFSETAVAGSSAGGYGALLLYPEIREALGEGASYSLIVDSANAVLTDGFLDRVFGPADVWGTISGATLDSRIAQVFALPARNVPPELVGKVSSIYPDTRISQTTHAYDVVQSGFLWLMKQSDAGRFDPYAIPDPAAIARIDVHEWSPRARRAMLETASLLSNYRFYEAAGAEHVLLLDGFFDEHSAGGVPLTSWLSDMLYNPRVRVGTDWRNLSCFPDCVRLPQ